MQKQVQYIIKGMLRDPSISKSASEFSFENMNIRITARENNTLLSVTNEKGNKEVTLNIPIEGLLIGHCVLNNFIILFSKGEKDNIYVIESDLNGYTGKLLYSGNLNFNVKNPIEATGIYESEDIQKVYWVDGLNQPRVINITASTDVISKWLDNSFDFVRSLNLKEEVLIEKSSISNGISTPGVLQYSFSYYNKYSQESSIFYTSPLYYVSYNNRGASPEDKVGSSFNITINGLDKNFEIVRIYSTLRSSIDSIPETRRVVDLAIPESGIVNYIDNGTTGDIIDPTILLYLGGEEISAYTMTHKDNTLFFGNLKLKRRIIDKEIRDYFRGKTPLFVSYRYGAIKSLDSSEPVGYYPYDNQLKLNSLQIKTFKYLETYRLGVQFQHYTGKWSEPIWLNDVRNTTHVGTSYVNQEKIYLPAALFELNYKPIIEKIVNQGYVKVRPVIVYPSLTDRECICQGVLCPTVFNVGDRYDNSPFSQSSWFVRANAPFDEYKSLHYAQDPSSGEWGGDWWDREKGPLFPPTTNSRAGVMTNDKVNLTYVDSNNESSTIIMDLPNKGAWAEFRHLYPIPSNDKRNAEIQCIWNPPSRPEIDVNSSDADISAWISKNTENFYIDQSIITLHSPDIEFDDNLKNLDTSELQLRIVGMVPLTAFVGDIDIQTSTPPNNYNTTIPADWDYIDTEAKERAKRIEIAPGFYKEPIGSENISRFGWRGLVSGAFWFDELSNYKEDKGNLEHLATGFVVYPFHRNGSLNNTKEAKDGYRSAMLDKKKISNMRFSYNTYFLDQEKIYNFYAEEDNYKTGVSGITVFDSSEVSLVRLPAQKYSGLGDINYYGNVDKVINISRIGDKKDGYPIIVSGTQNLETNAHGIFSSGYKQVDSKYTKKITGVDPIRMKYKSTPHAVIALNYSKYHHQIILPTIKDGNKFSSELWDVNKYETTSKRTFWDKNNICYGVHQDILDIPLSDINGSFDGYSIEYGWLWLGEIYNPEVTNRFGGQTEEAFENNQWLPCGEPVSLVEDNNNIKSNVIIAWTEGDTYYQRYDHLKTYPFTLEDQNAITDIVSFMCETRVNLDGRYDRNRGQTNNFAMTPTNFNLMNNVYSQQNNFFNYRALNYKKFNLDYFPNTITWTKRKSLGELIDTWSNITMASTLDLDGDKGEITSLNTFNNEIFCFQKKGLSNILFNSRVQIPTSDGAPIEITNGLKVDGKRYIGNNIGCDNKWSIVQSSRGLYFVDGLTNALYLFNGQFDILSNRLGFRQWVSENTNNSVWDPELFNNFISFYDRINNDVYFVKNDTCLCYSELLDQFTSFMSYEGVSAMFNVEDKFLSFKNGKLWEQNEGEYNKFFGEFKPYYIIYRVNPEEPLDKIFNNIEFRADTWDGELLTNKTFNTLDVWNEYQSGTLELDNIQCKPSPLKKKFRIWRANIPRDNTNHRDRIRNPWIYLKLSMNKENNYRTELHDMIVHYFE